MGGNPISRVLYCMCVCTCLCACAHVHSSACVWGVNDYQEQQNQLLLKSHCVVQMSCLDQSNESINGPLY